MSRAYNKYRFVWRRLNNVRKNTWQEKHVLASGPELAVERFFLHVHSYLNDKDLAEIDHLFFEIKSGGLSGNDRLDYTMKADYENNTTKFIKPLTDHQIIIS
ncbi:hypothetical protein R6242_16340 [Iodobacter sp. CM08]|uniref:hypothetical protein n=1 Tax=Iodobacter sp. CM08 TaxID=3085902 RepID=UPI00298176F2|nr:hypothetical protein [Iodobacter sp. CM08]MDW5418136.1 hypothetical protein [Iodobacter sp. CM08]